MNDDAIINPLTKKPVTDDVAEYIRGFRKARSEARKPARSGNPNIAAPALAMLEQAPRYIRGAYLYDAQRRLVK